MEPLAEQRSLDQCSNPLLTGIYRRLSAFIGGSQGVGSSMITSRQYSRLGSRFANDRETGH
jgi:hypothetical protein